MQDIIETKCYSSIDESTDFIIQAQTCLLTAARAVERRYCFSNGNIFELLRKSVHKFLLGYFMCYDRNHSGSSIADLITDFRKIHPMDDEFTRDLLAIEQTQNDNTHMKEAEGDCEYIEKLFIAAQRLSQIVLSKLNQV